MINHPQSAPPEGTATDTIRAVADDAKDAAQTAARKHAQIAGVVADEVDDMADTAANVTEGVAKRVTGASKHVFRSASETADAVLATSREYVRRNPIPSFLGVLALGTALGCLVMMARRKPSFGERYVEEPIDAMREAILGALSPVTRRVHQGYDSARDGAGKAICRMNRLGKGRTGHSFADQIGRIGSNLKFW